MMDKDKDPQCEARAEGAATDEGKRVPEVTCFVFGILLTSIIGIMCRCECKWGIVSWPWHDVHILRGMNFRVGINRLIDSCFANSYHSVSWYKPHGEIPHISQSRYQFSAVRLEQLHRHIMWLILDNRVACLKVGGLKAVALVVGVWRRLWSPYMSYKWWSLLLLASSPFYWIVTLLVGRYAAGVAAVAVYDLCTNSLVSMIKCTCYVPFYLFCFSHFFFFFNLSLFSLTLSLSLSLLFLFRFFFFFFLFCFSLSFSLQAAVAAAATVATAPEPPSTTKSRMRKAVRWLPKWPSLGKAARDDPSWGDPARVRYQRCIMSQILSNSYWSSLFDNTG